MQKNYCLHFYADYSKQKDEKFIISSTLITDASLVL